MSSSEKHIDRDQLERLIQQHTKAGPERWSADLIDPQDHLELCSACREVVSRNLEGQRLIQSVKQTRLAHSSECPPQAFIQKVVAHLADEADAEAFLQHATQCDPCGTSLRSELQMLSGPTNEEEISDLAALRTSNAEWQRDFAATLAATQQELLTPRATGTRSSPWSLRVVFALSATIAVCVALSIWMSRNRTPDVNKLLAKAYSDSRILEVRLSDAPYSPIRQTRGGTQIENRQSLALKEAETIIQAKLQEQPANPLWLQERGRVEILRTHSDAAISTLQQAQLLEPASTSVRVDLATAYFERAERGGGQQDYELAYQTLTEVLAESPDNPIARYNRAIIAERLSRRDVALADWERYLQIDSQGEWAEDARRHLLSLQKIR